MSKKNEVSDTSSSSSSSDDDERPKRRIKRTINNRDATPVQRKKRVVPGGVKAEEEEDNENPGAKEEKGIEQTKSGLRIQVDPKTGRLIRDVGVGFGGGALGSILTLLSIQLKDYLKKDNYRTICEDFDKQYEKELRKKITENQNKNDENKKSKIFSDIEKEYNRLLTFNKNSSMIGKFLYFAYKLGKNSEKKSSSSSGGVNSQTELTETDRENLKELENLYFDVCG